MTAKDVVASMKQYVGAKASNAGLSPFFDAAGVSAKGNYTVVFKLKSPIGVFPYLLSQTTYQAIIQPASIAANPGTWVKSGMIGTGAFKLTNYVDKKSATLVRNPSYWGGPAPMDGVKITFYQGSAPMVLALRAGQIDLAMQLSPQEGAPFKSNSKYKYYALPTSAHRQVCMRTDTGVLKDPARAPGRRARRSIARSSWRRSCSGPVRSATTTRSGRASPRPTGRSKQRTQNIALAKSLLAAAGATNLKFNLTTWQFLDHTDHAASIQAYAKRGRDRHRHRGHGRRQVLRLRAGRGGLRHHDPVAEPHGDADGVRRPWRAEHLPDPVLHVDR